MHYPTIAHVPDDVSVAWEAVNVKPTPLLIVTKNEDAAVTVPSVVTVTQITHPVTAAVVAITPDDPAVNVNVPLVGAVPLLTKGPLTWYQFPVVPLETEPKAQRRLFAWLGHNVPAT